jgi:hypothetical protein
MSTTLLGVTAATVFSSVFSEESVHSLVRAARLPLSAFERRHPTGRESMGSPTLQTLQEPILRTPRVAFGDGNQGERRHSAHVTADGTLCVRCRRRSCSS